MGSRRVHDWLQSGGSTYCTYQVLARESSKNHQHLRCFRLEWQLRDDSAIWDSDTQEWLAVQRQTRLEVLTSPLSIRLLLSFSLLMITLTWSRVSGLNRLRWTLIHILWNQHLSNLAQRSDNQITRVGRDTVGGIILHRCSNCFDSNEVRPSVIVIIRRSKLISNVDRRFCSYAITSKDDTLFLFCVNTALSYSRQTLLTWILIFPSYILLNARGEMS